MIFAPNFGKSRAFGILHSPPSPPKRYFVLTENTVMALRAVIARNKWLKKALLTEKYHNIFSTKNLLNKCNELVTNWPSGLRR